MKKLVPLRAKMTDDTFRTTTAMRIAVVDDHPMMRGGLVTTFDEVEGFEVVATGGDADAAVRIALEKSPDIMIVDLNMPGGGVSVIERLRRSDCPVPVIIISASDDFVSINTAFDAGARGFISKGVTAGELTAVVRQAVGGAQFVTAVPPREGSGGNEFRDQSAKAPSPFDVLRHEEAVALRLLADGKPSAAGASGLEIAEQRIALLIANIRKRMRLRKRISSVVAALLARR